MREFSYVYDRGNGTKTRTGPDGVDTRVEFDIWGRATRLVRGYGGTTVVEADYQYYDNDLPLRATYYNPGGTVNSYVDYYYYDTNQIMWIEHLNDVGLLTQRLEYSYTATGLPSQITEFDASGQADFVTTFDYDSRGRLIHELRYYAANPTIHLYEYRYKYVSAQQNHS